MDDRQREKLSELMAITKSSAERELNEEYKELSANIQQALSELGFDPSLSDATNLWEAYSQSMHSNWLSGAETIRGAREFIESFLDDVYDDIC